MVKSQGQVERAQSQVFLMIDSELSHLDRNRFGFATKSSNFQNGNSKMVGRLAAPKALPVVIGDSYWTMRRVLGAAPGQAAKPSPRPEKSELFEAQCFYLRTWTEKATKTNQSAWGGGIKKNK